MLSLRVGVSYQLNKNQLDMNKKAERKWKLQGFSNAKPLRFFTWLKLFIVLNDQPILDLISVANVS